MTKYGIEKMIGKTYPNNMPAYEDELQTTKSLLSCRSSRAPGPNAFNNNMTRLTLVQTRTQRMVRGLIRHASKTADMPVIHGKCHLNLSPGHHLSSMFTRPRMYGILWWVPPEAHALKTGPCDHLMLNTRAVLFFAQSFLRYHSRRAGSRTFLFPESDDGLVKRRALKTFRPAR